MKKVVLFDTSVGSLNQGDEIINISIKNNWNELFEKSYHIKLASHTPLYTPLQCFLYKKGFDPIKNADYKFLCGTNALYVDMLRPRPQWNINIFNCSLAVNTVCLGVGTGINRKAVNFYTKRLYEKVLSHKFIHSVRDRKTQEFLENMGFKAVNTGCPTLWGITKELCAAIPTKKAEKAVFTLTYYNPDPVLDKKMIDILRSNYAGLFFWPQCIKDLDYLRSLDNIDDIKVITPNVQGFDKVLKEEDIDYIGNRLHGGIYSIQHARRTVIIAIDHRAENMHENYSFGCINRKAIPEDLENKINSEWDTTITGIDHEKIKMWKNQFEF